MLPPCHAAYQRRSLKPRQRLPFPSLRIDSDNSSQFSNDLLYRYCMHQEITFTRSRPYQKNDQAHVELKNWSAVRHTVDYDRWKTEPELVLLESIHDDLRLYINFFQPSFKLIAKACTEPVEVNVLAIRPSNRMIQPRPLTNAYLNAKLFLYQPKRNL
jgi:hypothetical protein